MSLIPDDVIEQVREAADLVGIIGEQVELKRTGADYRGPCPFHGGTHRNFAVIPKKGMFYCFVCHEAGDVFTFFMKKLGMDYPTAVRERSEEHTSELQSLAYLVCRLLLEKKKIDLDERDRRFCERARP